jgi:MFS family permease
MAETAIAIGYPEPYNRGKVMGYWLTYRLGGQILGGAINLGLNASNDHAGKVSYTVYLIFIAIQAAGPFVGFLLSKPEEVQRTDGKKVNLSILDNPWFEIRATTKLFFSKKFLLIILFIGQAVYTEVVFFTYLSLYFSVRARALGSFVSGVAAVICGNLVGFWLDRTKIPIKTRTRVAFFGIMTLQLGWWIWATVLVTKFRHTQPTYDWDSEGIGHAFSLFVFWVIGFQLEYLFLYFVISQLAKSSSEIIRYAALLRWTESAWQAVSYELNSIHIFAAVRGVYLNFAVYGLALVPA